ncbi:spermine oxidase-like [Contarinia nasturtii]|uniref:spermine oxidase-like n=1 Tax=Contarinia nasturtii TaxID=265458 RepID=UPI0012D47883|nr:spermine oxidase-like [Contarinia nasturtii]XP_031636093.1 spermine oxidase-like [Contarinia nasturtii]XP_031636094.1 spermine oxidase-like [Contarinia nasturtii]
MEKKIIKIIIVGAGASGFAAASKLISNGFENVTILEAENRIGGRVHTIDFGANVLDMGAQWCHGESGNVVYEMAKDKNLLSSNVPTYKTFNFVRSNGEEIPAEISERLTKLAMGILDRNDREREKRAYHGSLGNYFAQRFYEAFRTPEYSDIDSILQHEAFDWFHRMRTSWIACDLWYDVSCGNYLEYCECPGNMMLNWKEKGYRTVFDLLQNKIPSGGSDSIDVESKVLLNKEVSKITYDQTTTEADRIKIKCSDGSEHSCDHLICTVSLGVLKKNYRKMFEPSLPDYKVDSIEGIGFGTVDKIYVEFTKPFWNEEWEGVSFLWKPEEMAAIREDPINGEWMSSIIGFYPVSFQPNILCGWITGQAARKMEQVNDNDLKTGVNHVLKLFLKEWNGAEVKNTIGSKWSSNPHFNGSFSYYSLRSDTDDASTSNLATPIYDANKKPIIQFGGEATNTHFYSTVHGAVGSGWREAQRLIDSYCK